MQPLAGRVYNSGYVDALNDVLGTLDKGERKWARLWPADTVTTTAVSKR